MTPLAFSNAVPVLSGATHEVVTAEEVGLGGVSEEELTELRQMLANTAELVMELQDQHRQSLHEMQEVAVELATAATSWLTGVAIDRGEFAVDDLIRKALHQMEIDQPVRVRLNPADHDLLKNLIRDPAGRRMLENVSCFDDPELARGTCRVESGRRIVLSDMESRLENIRRSWMEKLDDSQVERRGDGSTSRTLRRFPERRETA
jgi:flagellar biosynthesis/type III secretory pathway protein FliH